MSRERLSVVDRVESLAAAWAKHDNDDGDAADLRALIAVVKAAHVYLNDNIFPADTKEELRSVVTAVLKEPT